MRTTVDIPDPLYEKLKSTAITQGRSVKELILRAVEQDLRVHRRTPPKRVRLPLIRSRNAGSLELNNAKIYKIIPFP